MCDTLVIPVLVEEPDIQKSIVKTGKVFITKQVHEREVIVDEPLVREAARLRRKAGADPKAIPARIEERRRRSAWARRPPFSGGLR